MATLRAATQSNSRRKRRRCAIAFVRSLKFSLSLRREKDIRACGPIKGLVHDGFAPTPAQILGARVPKGPFASVPQDVYSTWIASFWQGILTTMSLRTSTKGQACYGGGGALVRTSTCKHHCALELFSAFWTMLRHFY